MGISSLRPFLRSLCCNTPWNYAMFWKIKDQNEKILVWEDSFCDILKPRDPMLCPMEDFYLVKSNKMFPSAFTSSVLDGTPHDFGLAVAEMASSSHLIGKGVIGKAAVMDEAQWIYSVNFTTDMSDSVSVSEYPDEWLLQFAAGIKTILLLPVLPHGVLQLGSSEMVAQDAEWVASIKHKFDIHIISVGSYWESSLPHFSASVEPSITLTDEVYENQKPINTIWIKDCNLFAEQMTPVSAADLCYTSAVMSESTIANVIDSEVNQQSSSISRVGGQCGLLSDDNRYRVTGNNSLKSSHIDDITMGVPYFDHYNGTTFGEFVNDLSYFHFEEGAVVPTSTWFDFDDSIYDTGINFSSFSGDLEVLKALEPTVVGNPHHYDKNSSLASPNEAFRSTVHGNPIHNIGISGTLSAEPQMSEVEVENLLETVIANVCSSSDDDNSTNRTNVTSVYSPIDKPLTSPERPGHHKRSASSMEDQALLCALADSFIPRRKDASPKFSASASSGKSAISVLTDKQPERKEGDIPKPEKLSRLSRTNKRRVHSGDSQRPRPRDRQLIQDRIKELRELVPNTGKCSIDGLLDKTIKHMVHLRSMTDQADKLGHVLKEETERKTSRTDKGHYGRESGTSWAVELGSEMQSCPIVVKDLDPPGHMLIEMLCNDFNRFLEITDVIHRSQLTILKGVMENSSDNALARFIVEASGSFHRLDIFWPLMQLLQKSPPVAAIA